ncbi:glycoside hydrolase family 18 protein [Sporobolomyces salmoneus]|uniref:glycoside hydrolase family 18 protein n=1 Tax=Sporobolomyces salmoneus TaxID=183962 RepID=UPI00317402D2
MRSFLSQLVLMTITLVSFVSAASPIVAQYWAAYGGGLVSDVAWQANDIAYYFVTTTTATGFEVPEGQSISELQEFVKYTKSKGARPVFSVGGWSGSIYFSKLIETDAKRQAFANDLHDFMVQYGFVGIDLDYEFPNGKGIGCNAISPDDSANFVLFLKELRSIVGKDNLLTAAVSVSGINGPDGSALSSFAEYGSLLDYINLMTYDISGSWSQITGPNSPLRTCKSDTSVQAAVSLWKSRGFPAERILLGVPAYAVSFTTTSSTLAKTETGSYTSQIYQEWTKQTPMGAPGDSNAAYTDQCGTTSAGYSGQWQFNELISNGILSEDGTKGLKGYERIWDQCSETPFLFNSETRQMIVYDDAKSAGLKAAYARSEGLGGIMIFDTRGFTGTDVVSSIRQNLTSRRCRRHQKTRRRA